MSDDDLIRRGDALDLRDKLADIIGARPVSSIHSALCEYRNAIAALPAAPIDALVERLCVAAQDMVTVARQDGWAEATTGRQIILRAVQDALAAYQGEKK